MKKFKELLNRKVGPFAIWVWLVLLALGAAIGFYLRARSAERGEDTPGDPSGDIHADPGFGVPYTGGYVGYPATTPDTSDDWFRDVLEAIAFGVNQDRFTDPNDPVAEGETSTSGASSTSSYQIGTFDYQLAGSDEILSGQISEIDPAELEGATVFSPVEFTVEGGRAYYEYQTDIMDSTKEVSKPLSNMLRTQEYNQIQAENEAAGLVNFRGEWLTPEEYQRRLAALK